MKRNTQKNVCKMLYIPELEQIIIISFSFSFFFFVYKQIYMNFSFNENKQLKTYRNFIAHVLCSQHTHTHTFRALLHLFPSACTDCCNVLLFFQYWNADAIDESLAKFIIQSENLNRVRCERVRRCCAFMCYALSHCEPMTNANTSNDLDHQHCSVGTFEVCIGPLHR